MAILLSNEQNLEIDENLVGRIAKHVLEAEGVPAEAELSIAFIDEVEMARLNETYRGVAQPTDVLSFPMEDEAFPGLDSEQPLLLGDVIIAPSIAKKNVKELEFPFEAEIGLLVVHGILHLLGYDHEVPEKAEEMEAKERELLRPFFGGVFES